MPLTPKQERFCYVYRETGNSTTAYCTAYKADRMSDGAIRHEASKLLDNPNISAFLRELASEAQARHMITLDKLTDMTVEAYDIAKAEAGTEGASAMVRAVAQLSRMHGFDAKERENDRMPLGDALAMVLERRKSGDVEGTVH